MTGSLEQTRAGRWRVRWYTTEGKHPSRTFATKQEADQFRAKLAAGLEDTDSRLTLKALVDEWWAVAENSVKPRTAERYLAHLAIIQQYLPRARIADLTYQRLQRFVLDLQKQYKPRTVTHTYAVLVLVLKHGQRLGVVSKVPAKPILPKITKPRLVIPTKEQVERLAAASDARFHAAVLLAGYGGLRQGEILALSRSDVNLAKGWVLVERARNKTTGAIESTKTDASRRVYMPERLSVVVAAHLDEFPDTDLLFPQTVSSFQKSWVRARKACGLTGVRFHDLRHAAASLYIHAGWSPTQVAVQLGHSDPAMTLRTYSHLWPQSYEDALAKINAHLDATLPA